MNKTRYGEQKLKELHTIKDVGQRPSHRMEWGGQVTEKEEMKLEGKVLEEQTPASL